MDFGAGTDVLVDRTCGVLTDQQLAEIRALLLRAAIEEKVRGCRKDNWDGHGSAAVTKAAIDTACTMQVVPLPGGGIQIEWHAGGMDIEIEIDETGRIADVWSQHAEGKG